ncbi:MAG: hypothetical protein ACI8X5_001826, partial [Planctomycetota bacterium]
KSRGKASDECNGSRHRPGPAGCTARRAHDLWTSPGSAHPRVLLLFLLRPALRSPNSRLERHHARTPPIRVQPRQLDGHDYDRRNSLAARSIAHLGAWDAEVWQRSRLRHMLSAKIGFLIERGSSNRDLPQQLKTFGRSHGRFNLIVFPEGTRGDGRNVAECQPGIYTIAQAAGIPIVPVFISGMQKVSSKTTRVHPIADLRSISVQFGSEISPQELRGLDRAEFSLRIQGELQALAPGE